jgi:hypothetical protein
MWCLLTYSIPFCYGFPLKGMWASNRFCEWTSGLIDTARSDPVGLIDTAVSNPMVSMTPLNPLPLSHWDYGIFYKNVQVRSRGVINTMESELFKQLSRFSQRIWSQMQIGFSPWIRTLVGNVWWTKPRVENFVALSLYWPKTFKHFSRVETIDLSNVSHSSLIPY